MCGPHHCLGRDTFASGPEILRRLLQWRQNASIIGQGCAGHSPNSAKRKHQITRHPWRTSPSLRPCLSFRYTQLLGRMARMGRSSCSPIAGFSVFRMAAAPAKYATRIAAPKVTRIERYGKFDERPLCARSGRSPGSYFYGQTIKDKRATRALHRMPLRDYPTRPQRPFAVGQGRGLRGHQPAQAAARRNVISEETSAPETDWQMLHRWSCRSPGQE
jgi:hypothetical protein